MQKAKGQRLLRRVNKITVTRSQETRSDDIKPAHQEGRSKKTDFQKWQKSALLTVMHSIQKLQQNGC